MADEECHAMHKHWTPAGAKKITSDAIPVSKREFVNHLNMLTQQINNLMLKAGSSSSVGGTHQGKFCHDCGVKEVIKCHPGHKNPGAGLFKPEKSGGGNDNGKSGGSSAKGTSSSSSSTSSDAVDCHTICDEPIPNNEEKMWNGEKWVMCCKC